jgi:hypothetical protein
MFVPPVSRHEGSGARPRPRALGKPQFGDVKILMMDAKDGVDGVRTSYSSFVPSRSI